MKALVLLAHGSRDPQGRQPLAQVRAWVQSALPGQRVEEAYLNLNQPLLDGCLEGLERDGITDICLVPMLVAQGHHLNVELPVILADLQLRFPGLELALSPHLGADAGIVDLVLRRAAQARPCPAPARPPALT